MAKSSDGDSGSFDLDRLRKLLQLMEKYGVTETQLTKDGESWKVRRGPKEVAAAPAQVAAPLAAPTVGTFYSAPNPEEPPFASVGTKVDADTIVCTIEAMKVFNQIPAEKSGTIVEVLVENGDPVEFGQPLFRIE
jgi:acetyl-CoA carboxylase biotin carboxyl carrier protein